MVDAISVVGLGKVGSAIVATYASKNIRVYGFDIDEKVLQSLNNYSTVVPEKDVNELLYKYKNYINFTNDLEEAVLKSNFTFIILPTPSNENNQFSNSYILNACTDIAKIIKFKNDFHTICISSTVMPGTHNNLIKPLVENLTGKKEGIDFGLAYSPEFIALGNIVENLINPDLILVGSSNDEVFYKVSNLKKIILKNTNNMINLNFDEAEIVKLSINSFITMKISFANMIGEISEKSNNVNKFKVLETIGKDTRIGSKFIKPGLGYGGPCFPRDNKALTSYAQDLGVDCALPIATDTINEHQVGIVYKKIINHLQGSMGPVLFLGISYKEGTSSIEESQIISVGRNLIKDGVEVHYHDYNVPKQLVEKNYGFKEVNLQTFDEKKYSLIIFSQKDLRYSVFYDLIKQAKYKVIDLWGLFVDE